MQVETRMGNLDDNIVSEALMRFDNIKVSTKKRMPTCAYCLHILFNTFKCLRLEGQLHVSVEHYRGRTLSAETH